MREKNVAFVDALTNALGDLFGSTKTPRSARPSGGAVARRHRLTDQRPVICGGRSAKANDVCSTIGQFATNHRTAIAGLNHHSRTVDCINWRTAANEGLLQRLASPSQWRTRTDCRQQRWGNVNLASIRRMLPSVAALIIDQQRDACRIRIYSEPVAQPAAFLV